MYSIQVINLYYLFYVLDFSVLIFFLWLRADMHSNKIMDRSSRCQRLSQRCVLVAQARCSDFRVQFFGKAGIYNQLNFNVFCVTAKYFPD